MTVRVGLFDAKGNLVHEGSYELEVFSAEEKGKQLEFPGGYPQSLIK